MEKSESDTKHCNKCDQDKPLDQFGKNPRYCKSCVNSYSRKHYAKDPEKKKAKVKEWQKLNPEKLKEYYERWKETHPEEYAKHRDKWFNGPTLKDLEKLIQEGILIPITE